MHLDLGKRRFRFGVAVAVCFAVIAAAASRSPAFDGRDVFVHDAYIKFGMPSAKSDDAALKASAALYDGVREETLANGLRVYLKPFPTSPVVTTMVAYKVGSADEDLDNTGLSHYLEHLMFKGTDKLMPGDIDHQTLINGGANNAYTSTDYTIFHFDLAADRWEMSLGVEADRMRNLKIDARHEFQQEKGAVIAELSRDEDEPWDLEQKAILPLLFGPKNPYGHPVIGQRKQVEDATATIIKAHYDKWYHPNNATLIVCGGIDPDRALATIKKLFGPIPKEALPERKPTVPIEHKAPVHHEFTSKFEVPRMLMGFNTVDSNDPDLPALEVAQSVLSGGKTSRFYKKFIEGEEIASSADAFHTWGRYPGWFGVQLELLPGKERNHAEELVLAEFKRLANEPVPKDEMDRVRQGIIAGAIFDRESVHNMADNMAQGLTNNDLPWLKAMLPRLAAVTAADIQRVAKKYLDPEKRVVVWSVPKPEESKGAGADAPAMRRQSLLGSAFPGRAWEREPRRGAMRLSLSRRDDSASATAGAGASPPAEFSLEDTKRFVLPNGLVLLLWENHRLPIVVASAHVSQVALREPAEQAGLAALMGGLLDEGTTKHTGPEIAELIENVGGSLSLSSSGGTVKVLAGDRQLGLKLLIECLKEPSFPTEAFNREREHQLAAIDEAQREPLQRATIRFRKELYGKHPFALPSLGTQPIVSKLTPADCRAFHDRLFVPNNVMLVIAGDFKSDEVLDEVTKLTSTWKSSPLSDFKPPEVEKPKDFVEEIISMPEAEQLQFLMGHPGIRRDNPDYYKLLVMDYVLGTGPGFTDRLSSRLRDREGLAYTVTANICSSASEEPGLFTCYIGTEAKNLDRVKQMFLEELKRIRTEPPKPEEVEDVKKYLLGQLPFEFTTNEQVAGRLLGVERYHLGFNYLADFRRAISAVTPQDVLDVAKKHIDPDHMVLIVAGAVDENGKVLSKAAEK
jgi:zinc protease